MSHRKSEIHMHSNHSDGQFSPNELVNIAAANGVSIVALTDHDTFSGVQDFVEAARSVGISAIPGIEMTVHYRDFNVHLLGYFPSVESISKKLWDRVETMKADREERMRNLIARINEVIPDRFKDSITLDNVKKGSEGVLARPHLAREMVRLGIVESTGEAFDRYLVKYNVEKENLDIREALKMIRQSRGIPVLAHPGERTYSLYNPDKGRKREAVPEMVEELKSWGLLGLECIYPYHEKIGEVNYFLSLAETYDLVATGSRDFHGTVTHQKPEVLGTTPMDDTFYRRFEALWTEQPDN